MREMSSAMTISASRVSSLIDMDDDESISKMLRKENPLYGGIIPPFVRCAPAPDSYRNASGRAGENKALHCTLQYVYRRFLIRF